MRLAEVVPLAMAACTLVLAAWLALDQRKRRKRMPGFNAATVVEALDWTFEPAVHARGTVKEPTDDQIVQFLTDVKELAVRLKAKAAGAGEEDTPGTSLAPAQGADVEPPKNPADIVDAIEDLDPAVVGEFHRELAAIFEALCSGEPSKETLLSLPMRIRVMFYSWLREQVMDPEAAPGAGNAQVTTLRSAAAG